MVAGRPKNLFTEDLKHAFAASRAEAVRKGLEDRDEQEAKKPEGPTKEYVGKTGWKITVSGTSGKRGWSSKQIAVTRRGGGSSVSEALNPKAAERAARGMENFAQYMALAMMRAVDNDPSAAAGIARELATTAGAYEKSMLVLSEEAIAKLDENKPGRADWAQKKIAAVIGRHGRDEVADVLGLLANVFERK